MRTPAPAHRLSLVRSIDLDAAEAHQALVVNMRQRGASILDYPHCPHCESRAHYQVTEHGHDAVPVCMNPPCIYARTKAASAAQMLVAVDDPVARHLREHVPQFGPSFAWCQHPTCIEARQSKERRSA